MKLGAFDRTSTILYWQIQVYEMGLHFSSDCFLVYLVIFCALAFTPNSDCTPANNKRQWQQNEHVKYFICIQHVAPTFTKISEGFDNSSTVDAVQRHSSKYYAFILIFPVPDLCYISRLVHLDFMKFIVRSAKAVVRFVLYLIEMLPYTSTLLPCMCLELLC
jgi:hypothetical protein